MAVNNLWEQFDKAIDVEGLQMDIKEAAENGKIPTIKRKEFRELPEPGTWEYEAEQNFFREKYGEPEYSYEDNDTFRLLMDF